MRRGLLVLAIAGVVAATAAKADDAPPKQA